MSESGDYTPAPHWRGHDFDSARKAHGVHIDRSYKDAIAASVDPLSLVPKSLLTECEAPLVIAIDVTGSMGEWPKTIFSKLPYLEHEGKEYLGEGMEISFCAIGDAFSDKYPLQVQSFVRGAELKTSLEKLVHEHGGGGSSEESYDLSASYYANNCEMPKAIRKPVFIFIGDEGIYQTIDAVKTEQWALVENTSRLTPQSVFEKLKQKFSVYIIRKPYNCDSNLGSPDNTRIQNQWCKILGDDHVVSLTDPTRVVDVIFGILAKETGRIDYFTDELTERQGKDRDGKAKIDIVLKSLKTIHSVRALPPKVDRAKSVTKKKASDKSRGKSISLLDD